MELLQLEKKLLEKDHWLEMKLSEAKDLISKYPEAKKAYQIALASKILELRANSYPATLIPELARGDKNVAQLRLEKDIAKALSDNINQVIVTLRASINAFQSLISLEKEKMKLL